MVLSGKIDWKEIDRVLAPYCSPGKGRPAKPARLMVGLMILRHRFDLSDDAPWCMGFSKTSCGWPSARSRPDEARHVESSTLCQFTKRLGPEGIQAIEAVIREQMIQAGAIKRKVMRVDTTAMEKNIAYPTDIGLLQKSRMRVLRLVRKAKDLGVAVPKTLRTFARVSRKAVLSVAKFGRDKKDRVQKEVKKLAAMREHTLRPLPGFSREIGKSLRRNALKAVFPVLVRIWETLWTEARILERIVTQTKNPLREIPTRSRVYCAHEPEVACITKNKAGKPREYGIKVSLAVDERGIVVTHAEYPDNRNDATTLQDALDGWEMATGMLPRS